ncbi:MAG: hypothetical protein K6356_13345 [Chloroflexus sp.]
MRKSYPTVARSYALPVGDDRSNNRRATAVGHFAAAHHDVSDQARGNALAWRR